MADIPILFSAPMVRALLDGRKTQTRRVLKPWPGMQRKWLTMETLHQAPSCYLCEVNGHLGAQMQHPLAGTSQSYGAVDAMSPLGWVRLPYSVGDRLWVREAWKAHSTFNGVKPRDIQPTRIFYLADDGYSPSGAPGRPSMFMPRWASRLTLTVSDVRVQRLQDIGTDDAVAEGVARFDPLNMSEDEGGPVYRYAFIWDRINGAGAWDANPWVAAYTFSVEHRNIDEVRHAG